MIRQQIAIVMIVTAILAGCNNRSSLDRALELAGENRPELEAVLNHYKDNGSPAKLRVRLSKDFA